MKKRNYIKILNECIKDKDYRFTVLAKLGIYNGLSDQEYLQRLYKGYMKKELNLENPKTFNEKLQWLKLYDRKDSYTRMVDKYEAKKYVAEHIGEEYIIPTLGIWNTFEEINFDELPEKFVLKCTHDSGGLVICRNKEKFDKRKAKSIINKSLRNNYFYFGREWPYKNVKPRIIAEQYMEDSKTKDLKDYKIFTFDGKAKVMFIATDRNTPGEETKFDFFDMEFNHLNLTNGHPNASCVLQKPKTLGKMRELAEKLAEGIPQLRVDFYDVDGRIYFGELTFSHWSGLIPFKPEKYDEIFGSWITLPDN